MQALKYGSPMSKFILDGDIIESWERPYFLFIFFGSKEIINYVELKMAVAIKKYHLHVSMAQPMEVVSMFYKKQSPLAGTWDETERRAIDVCHACVCERERQRPTVLNGPLLCCPLKLYSCEQRKEKKERRRKIYSKPKGFEFVVPIWIHVILFNENSN